MDRHSGGPSPAATLNVSANAEKRYESRRVASRANIRPTAAPAIVNFRLRPITRRRMALLSAPNARRAPTS
jgi:hypothetical protein